MLRSIVTALAVAIAPPISDAPDGAPPNGDPTPSQDDGAPPADADEASIDDASAPAVDEAEPKPPARAVFRSAPPPEPAPPPSAPGPAATDHGPIGGYGDQFDLRGRKPKDGEDEVLAGSIVLPLGLLGVASSGVQLWLSMPGHCQERWGKLGNEPTADQCKGVYAFSIVRVVHSGLMAIAGGVLLGIGLHRRERYKRWKRGTAALPRLTGWWGRDGGGVGLVVRIGRRM